MIPPKERRRRLRLLRKGGTWAAIIVFAFVAALIAVILTHPTA